MRANPAVLFFAVWIGPLLAPLMLESQVITPITTATIVLVTGSIAMMFAIVIFFWLLRSGHSVDVESVLRTRICFPKLESISLKLFWAWLATYVIHIVYSGGVPLYWVLTGDARTYADFGVPTLGGLSNMLRAFILVACFIIFSYSNGFKRVRFLKLGLILMMSAFLLETGRGNGVVLLLHPVAIYLLVHKFTLQRALLFSAALALFLVALGGIQVLRYQDGMAILVQYAESQGFEFSNTVQLLLVPALIYYMVPLVNADLNVVASPLLSFEPYYSLQGLFPTVIRNFLFEAKDYGVLVSEANNVTSFFTPFIRDFGVIGAFFAVVFLLFITAFVYSKALSGKLFYILLWPAIFMSLVLSFFSLFYTSLVVVIYPVLALYVTRRVRIPLSEEDNVKVMPT